MWMGSDKPPEALGAYTGFLMNWCAARARQAFADALADVGLRPQQFAVMSIIAEQPGLTQQALVEATGIDASTMVQLLDGLELAGVAERRPHANDRRKRALHLSAAGRRMLDRGRRAADGVGTDVFGSLDESELATLHRLLRKLAGLQPD